MAVRLKSRAKQEPDGVLPSVPPRLPDGVDDALTSILMYFPHQKSRHVASDLRLGWLKIKPGYLRWLMDRVGEFDSDWLEECDPCYNVSRACKALEAHASKKATAPPKDMYEGLSDAVPVKGKKPGVRLKGRKVIRVKGKGIRVRLKSRKR